MRQGLAGNLSYWDVPLSWRPLLPVQFAAAAFDKVIAADPNKAAAYYWKGVNMIGKATLKGDKMVAPEGTAEAFQKYLEIEPTGTFAQPAKDMLASIGASIETTYGTKKKPVKK